MGMVVGRHQGAPMGEDEIIALMRARPDPARLGRCGRGHLGWHEHSYEKVLYCLRGRIVFHTIKTEKAVHANRRRWQKPARGTNATYRYRLGAPPREHPCP
jgi:hypothetical protein